MQQPSPLSLVLLLLLLPMFRGMHAISSSLWILAEQETLHFLSRVRQGEMQRGTGAVDE